MTQSKHIKFSSLCIRIVCGAICAYLWTSVAICVEKINESVFQYEGMNTEELTYAIIGSAMRVHNEIGPGLREKPYENALCHDLDLEKFDFVQQPSYPIIYRDKWVGECIPDIVVANQVVVEAKSIESIGDNELAQMLNYLRISGLKTGLILNFKNAKLEMKRVAK